MTRIVNRPWLIGFVLPLALCAANANAQSVLPQVVDYHDQDSLNEQVDAGAEPNPIVFDDEVEPSPRENPPLGQIRGSVPAQPDNLYQSNQRALPAAPATQVQPDGSLTPLANQRVQPEQGGGVRRETDPYAPLGIRRGAFTLYPTLTQSIGTTSNAEGVAGGSSAIFSETEARLRFNSDWSIHELRGEAGGAFQKFSEGEETGLPEADVSIELRLDHGNRLTTRVGANYRFATESAASDNINVPPPLSLTDRPNVHTIGAFAEVERNAGRLGLRLRGAVERTAYEDAGISDGSTLSQSDRDNTLIDAKARATFEMSSTFQPFGEIRLGSRTFDETLDRNGNERDSFIYGARAGFAFDRGDLLNGEIAIGYQAEEFEDNQLGTLDGVTIDGVLNWSPRRLTTVTATLSSGFGGATDANESGSVSTTGSIGIVRETALDLTLSAKATASYRSYVGSDREDDTVQAELGADWRLNRGLTMFGRLGYESVDSTDPDATYDATTARVGLRLSR